MQEDPLDNISAMPHTVSVASQFQKLLGRSFFPDAQVLITESSTAQAGMRSTGLYRALTCSHLHGHPCWLTTYRYLPSISYVRRSSLEAFGLPSFCRNALISFFSSLTSSITVTSTLAISKRLKGLNCMLLQSQMRPTFTRRVLEKENHEAVKGSALD